MGFSKEQSLSLCYLKLGMVEANNKIKISNLLQFNDNEIKCIIQKLQNLNDNDLDLNLFNMFTNKSYLKHKSFMDILDDILYYENNKNLNLLSVLKCIWNKLINILQKYPNDKQFELLIPNVFVVNIILLALILVC